MAELVDAADLKSVGSNPVPVRFRPSAPIKNATHSGGIFYWYDKQEYRSGTGAGLESSENSLKNKEPPHWIGAVLYSKSLGLRPRMTRQSY